MVAAVVVIAVVLVAVLTGFVVLARRTAALARQRAAQPVDPRLAGAELAAPEVAAARAQATTDAAAAVAQATTDAAAAVADQQARIRAETEAELADARARAGAREAQLSERDARLAGREERVHELEVRLAALEQRLVDRESRAEEERRRLDQARAEQAAAAVLLGEREAVLRQGEERRVAELERVAGLTAEEARAELVRAVETQARREAALLVREIEATARAQGDDRARGIVADAIQRVASEQTSESVVSVLHLPSDDMKGRIIGREGRNIRAFEAVTGVNVIIDDTPEAVLLSCFDPVRREVGRVALEALILDGRIHPQRIEDAYERARGEVDQLCARAAEDALLAVGIDGLHPQLTEYLGRLRYRTSYGQNVLKHLIETAHIAGGMAAELGVDPVLVKRCAFLHDIGKALTHEVEGSHAIVGADLARKYGESEAVAHAIEAHHNEVAPQTVEAVLTQASDSCSGGRPGARRESLESYVQRLERIEGIAAAHPGVEKVFAMQAGREVRVMVQPDSVDDLEAGMLARDIAKQIEEELTYPGQIRVTVVRESRAVEVAR